MQRSTKKRAAVICALGAISLLVLYLCLILFAFVSERVGNILAVLFVLVFVAIILGIIGGILLALRQRLQEIDGGEEDEARKY